MSDTFQKEQEKKKKAYQKEEEKCFAVLSHDIALFIQ